MDTVIYVLYLYSVEFLLYNIIKSEVRIFEFLLGFLRLLDVNGRLFYVRTTLETMILLAIISLVLIYLFYSSFLLNLTHVNIFYFLVVMILIIIYAIIVSLK